MKKRLAAWLLALVLALSLAGCGEDTSKVAVFPSQDAQQQDTLPDDDSAVSNLPDDGDDSGAEAIDEDGSFTSKEEVALYIHTYGRLPGNFITKKEAQADLATLGAESRGAKRIVFSTDGLIYYTGDHYESFELLYGEE